MLPRHCALLCAGLLALSTAPALAQSEPELRDFVEGVLTKYSIASR